MFESIFHRLTLVHWGCLIGGLIVANLLYSRYVTWSGLRKFNGPFLASFTDFWRFCYYWVSLEKVPALKLHEKYGDVVRFGPNCLSFAQPEAIKDIYDPGRNFSKVSYGITKVLLKAKPSADIRIFPPHILVRLLPC